MKLIIKIAEEALRGSYQRMLMICFNVEIVRIRWSKSLQLQRRSAGIFAKACSICSPHPFQFTFPQLPQLTLKHMDEARHLVWKGQVYFSKVLSCKVNNGGKLSLVTSRYAARAKFRHSTDNIFFTIIRALFTKPPYPTSSLDCRQS